MFLIFASFILQLKAFQLDQPIIGVWVSELNAKEIGKRIREAFIAFYGFYFMGRLPWILWDSLYAVVLR